MAQAQRYDLLQRIAAGGMGEVFLGRQAGEHGFSKRVAIKRILGELSRDPEFIIRFASEAKLAVTLNHANIVQVFDFARVDDQLFLVMEYVHGADLAKITAALKGQAKPPSVAVALHIGMAVLKGLAFAHERRDDNGPAGVVHCDISPANILISLAGEVKIADFGVAQALRRTRQRNRNKPVAGKYRYMAPEVLRGEPFDQRADLYSLAIVLQELLALEPVFAAPDAEALIQAVLKAPRRDLLQDRPDAPPALAELLGRAMSTDPAARPPSARAMLGELVEIALAVRPTVTDLDVGEWVQQTIGWEMSSSMTRPATLTAPPLNADAEVTASYVAEPGRDGLTIWKPVGRASEQLRLRRGVGLVALLGVAGVLGWRTYQTASIEPPRPVVRPDPPVAAPAKTESPPPLPASAPSKPKVASKTVRFGYLNVYAEPWAHVFVDGQEVGVTPLMQHKLAAGTHEVTLRHPARRTQTSRIQVVAGQTQWLDRRLDPQ